KVKVRVHRYPDGDMAVFHGPRLLASYDSTGKLKKSQAPAGMQPQAG
ncbi:MAG: transposase, partial [Zetaproteobacteria bacterium]